MTPGGSGALVWDAERLRIATDAAGVALWSWNVDTDDIALDERAHALWGVPRNGPITFEVLSAQIHPEDVNRVRVAFQATRALKGAYEIDFRILAGEDVRWISARGQGDDIGIADGIMFGVFLDVTERKQAEESREMLAGEMSHRVKNLFAIASALTAIAARSAASTTEMARDLTERLNALGRAHDLVRHVPGQVENKAALLGDLLAVLLAPYDGITIGDRVHVSVPEIRVGETAVTTLASRGHRRHDADEQGPSRGVKCLRERSACRSEMYRQTTQGFDHLPKIVRLGDKDGGGIEDAKPSYEVYGIAGRNDDRECRVPPPRVQGHANAVERTRHADVCEQNVEATRSIEQLDGFVSVRGLDHLETFVLQGLCGHQSDDGFILYE